eukprot:5034738-Pleurochrysis_carterae.AAC.1
MRHSLEGYVSHRRRDGQSGMRVSPCSLSVRFERVGEGGVGAGGGVSVCGGGGDGLGREGGEERERERRGRMRDRASRSDRCTR